MNFESADLNDYRLRILFCYKVSRHLEKNFSEFLFLLLFRFTFYSNFFSLKNAAFEREREREIDCDAFDLFLNSALLLSNCD